MTKQYLRELDDLEGVQEEREIEREMRRERKRAERLERLKSSD